jgi:hypothetical protein
MPVWVANITRQVCVTFIHFDTRTRARLTELLILSDVIAEIEWRGPSHSVALRVQRLTCAWDLRQPGPLQSRAVLNPGPIMRVDQGRSELEGTDENCR